MEQQEVVEQQAAHPAPRLLEPWFDYLPRPTAVKPGQRPVMPSRGKKNAGTVESQAARDKQAFDAVAHRYRAHVPDACHHHHKPARVFGAACPEDHIYADRGRRKPEWCSSTSLFDPITSNCRAIGSPGRVEMRPASAPSQRPQTAYASSSGISALSPQEVLQPVLQRRTARDLQGRYNPLLHTWTLQPDAAAQAVRQKESDRLHGFGATGIRRSPVKLGRTETTAGELLQPALQAGSEAWQAAEAGGVGQQGGRRPSSAAGRVPVRSGETWGTYDCLRHAWIVEPADKRFATMEASPKGLSFSRSCHTTSRSSSTSGGSLSGTLGSSSSSEKSGSNTGVGSMPGPGSSCAGSSQPRTGRRCSPGASSAQGVYNPITCKWTVAPARHTSMASLDFAPRSIFDERCFVRR